ncbi:HtaA domain-containing protein [Actinocorallia sp. A-T 12471]|uniref:HtaA domain-containing protein n=1 Tax=Actinocorallia sp. A-T 12471 TaxID=3089813 RepID=UPI0029D320DF|nr:HtaA domain-containing protein [Actinocorallia sp. A-T 12471]MDX6740925.1 HtaA domain-containing protein [Actinocorallia sp. A-T 12471]
MSANAGGGLVWGVKASFLGYVTRAEGEITVAEGADVAEGQQAFVFPASDEKGKFTGQVGFDAHGGMLKVTIADPWIEIADDGNATLSVVNPAKLATDRSQRITIAALGDIVPQGDGTAKANAVLTMHGVWLLGNVYAPGDDLDPVVFPWAG